MNVRRWRRAVRVAGERGSVRLDWSWSNVPVPRVHLYVADVASLVVELSDFAGSDAVLSLELYLARWRRPRPHYVDLVLPPRGYFRGWREGQRFRWRA